MVSCPRLLACKSGVAPWLSVTEEFAPRWINFNTISGVLSTEATRSGVFKVPVDWKFGLANANER